MTVIYDIVFVFSWTFDYRVMTGSCGYVAICFKYNAFTFEGTEWAIADCICHAVAVACPSAFRPHEYVFAVADKHKRAFDIIFGCHFFINGAVVERNNAEQIGRESNHIAMAPAAIEHIVLAIFIAEYKLVDGLCAIYNVVDEGFAEGIAIGTFGTVGYRYTDAAYFTFVHIVCTKEEIVFVISFDD